MFNEREAQDYLKNKYKLNSVTFNSIAWLDLLYILKKQLFNKKQSIRKYMIHRLLSGKMNYDTQRHCPYCKSIMDHNTHNDYFILYH